MILNPILQSQLTFVHGVNQREWHSKMKNVFMVGLHIEVRVI